VRFADGSLTTRVSGKRGKPIVSRLNSKGRGYAFEAAHAVVRFAREHAGVLRLRAGHAYDNPASGRILCKLGFRSVDMVPRSSRPRGKTIMQHRYVLAFSES
jgi:[ribosomal protein S5]-alanine N-acetyltransferase